MKVIKKHFREGLAEGRISGMGFGFLKRLSDTDFETVTPISPCKDYLNDALYAEESGRTIPKIYGFLYDGQQDIADKEHYYMCIKICGLRKFESTEYANEPEDIAEAEALVANRENLQDFMNQIEQQLGAESFTKIYEANDNHLVVAMPRFWSKKLYKLSMYTLLLRAFQNYDGSKPSIEYIDKVEPHHTDIGLMMSAKDNIKYVLTGGEFNQEYKLDLTSYTIHNYSGICNIKK